MREDRVVVRRGAVHMSWALVVVLASTVGHAGAASVSWKTARLKPAGISLQYPNTWTASRGWHTSADSNNGFTASDEGGGYLVVSTIPGQRFPGSLNDFTSKINGFLNQDPQASVHLLKTSAVKLNDGKTAYRSDIQEERGPNRPTDRSSALYVRHLDGVTAVSIQGVPDDPAGVKLIDHVLASVRRI